MAQFNMSSRSQQTMTEEKITKVSKVNLVKGAPNGLVAYCSAFYRGLACLQDICVVESKNGDVHLTFYNKPRTQWNSITRTSEPVLDGEGKQIYDSKYGCADKETREHIEDLIFDAVQHAMDIRDSNPHADIPAYQKGDEEVRVYFPAKEVVWANGSKIVAFVQIRAEGYYFMSDIEAREKTDGNAYLRMPRKQRLQNGQPVKQMASNGKEYDIYDDLIFFANKTDRELFENIVFDAVQKELNQA